MTSFREKTLHLFHRRRHSAFVSAYKKTSRSELGSSRCVLDSLSTSVQLEAMLDELSQHSRNKYQTYL